MFPYPTSLPLAAIQDVIATVEAESFSSNRTAFCNDLWAITGYALSQLVHEAKAVGFKAALAACDDGPCPTNDEACAMLKECAPAVEAKNDPAKMAIAINWKAILQWGLTLLLQLLGNTPAPIPVPTPTPLPVNPTPDVPPQPIPVNPDTPPAPDVEPTS